MEKTTDFIPWQGNNPKPNYRPPAGKVDSERADLGHTASSGDTSKPGFEPSLQGPSEDVRCTLTATNSKDLVRICDEIIRRAHEFNVKCSGAIAMPNKTLRITTRKTPCGEGSKTWDRFKMTIHKRIIDISAPMPMITHVVQVKIPNSVHFQVTTSS